MGQEILVKMIFKPYVIASICFCFTGFSCNNSENFYTDYYRSDLWRLPLLNPYELIVQKNANDIYNDAEWTIKLQFTKLDNITDQLNVVYINIQEGVIYGFGKKYPTAFFIIDTVNKTETYFKNEVEWSDTLKSKGISKENINDAWTLFNEFKKNGRLPWLK